MTGFDPVPWCHEAKLLADAKFEDVVGARGALSALPAAELLLTPKGAGQTPRNAERRGTAQATSQTNRREKAEIGPFKK